MNNKLGVAIRLIATPVLDLHPSPVRRRTGAIRTPAAIEPRKISHRRYDLRHDLTSYGIGLSRAEARDSNRASVGPIRRTSLACFLCDNEITMFPTFLVAVGMT